jgi:aminodeoxychorismate lyase
MSRVFLNGSIVPAEDARVPLTDRGLWYGDGLFETIRALEGRPCFWERHISRLTEGARFLRIALPQSPESLKQAVVELLRANATTDAVVRVMLTRGTGARGYSPRGADSPTLAMTVHARMLPAAALTLRTASMRVAAGDVLARFKTANKLVSVLARAEAEDNGADEALLLNTDGYLAEAAACNVFWISAGRIYTPPLAAGALSGVMRSVLLETQRQEGDPVVEQLATPADVRVSEGMFLTNSTQGVIPVTRWDGQAMPQPPRMRTLRQKLEEETRRSAG